MGKIIHLAIELHLEFESGPNMGPFTEHVYGDFINSVGDSIPGEVFHRVNGVSRLTGVHVNIQHTNFVAIINMAIFWCMAVDVQVIAIEPGQGTSELCVHIATSGFNLLFDGVGYIAVVRPAKGVVPLEKRRGVRSIRSSQRHKVTQVLPFQDHFDFGRFEGEKLLNADFFLRFDNLRGLHRSTQEVGNAATVFGLVDDIVVNVNNVIDTNVRDTGKPAVH